MKAKGDRLGLLRQATEAAHKPPGTACTVCQLPSDVLDLVGQLIAEKKRFTSIESGLEAIGYTIPAARISWHARRGHKK